MMHWTHIGYLPKRRVVRSRWVSTHPQYPEASFPVPLPVEEVCSVSNCIAGGPAMQMEEIPFNHYGCYMNPTDARQAAATEPDVIFDLFAYRLASIRFADGQEQQLQVPALDVVPLPGNFELLGHDAVELADGYSFGCSPLSCNGQTDGVALNRYCLVDTESAAIELARTFSITKPEPGPYCMVEVWRERGDDDAE